MKRGATRAPLFIFPRSLKLPDKARLLKNSLITLNTLFNLSLYLKYSLAQYPSVEP